MRQNPNAVLPIGTQIVTTVDVINLLGDLVLKKGAVGIIIKSPIDNYYHYRVRFVDGHEESLKRAQFAVHAHFQNEAIGGGEVDEVTADLFQYVIYRCVVGSRAYGLETEESDTDRRGIYLPPADLHWSLYGIPDELNNQVNQEQYWELQKFLTLALKANPNILECLYTPIVEEVTPLAQELLDMREVFLSQLIYQTYNGYVMSQFRKLKKDLLNYGHIRWKHAMHLIRLLLSGIIILRDGYVPVRVDQHRDKLLVIRDEGMEWEEVDLWRLQLHKEFDEAFQSTRLPERPDFEAVNNFLIRARRSRVE